MAFTAEDLKVLQENLKRGQSESKPVEIEFFVKKSTDEEKLNKTEKAFLLHLKHGGNEWVATQAITLKLGDDTRYTPDFAAVRSGRFTFYEVKGFWRDDAKVKINVASRLYRMFDFKVVIKTKSGWEITDVKP